MASIENRIVQMQFDNGIFERRLSETLRSMEKLNQTLANAGQKNGLTNLADSVRGFNLNPMSASIEGVSAKFLAMSTIAITALSNIVNRAVDAGARITKALGMDTVLGGFQEYSTQIGSIQTILANTASKGTNLDQVSAALDELNAYSDKTIYNFTEMTRNIGTFSAAGVGLDQSVQSIKGIANVAAISGSNSQQASTAMYQLSQAMATGTVKLMDWNSVVNAGMGGEVFQKALFETGKALKTIEGVEMGTTFKEWTDAGNSFRGSLQDGWLTAEVLTNTLAGFTGELTEAQILSMGYTQEQAQEIMRLGALGVESATKVRTLRALLDTTKEALSSGWAQSFRLIFGDFEEATDLFTGLSNSISGFIQRGADSRNEMLSIWKSLGGRENLLQGFENGFLAIAKIITPIKEAFKEIFPPMTGLRLAEITRGFRDFMETLIPSGQTIQLIRRIFEGLFGALEIGWTVIKEGVGFIADLVKELSGVGDGGFLKFLAKIGDFFREWNTKLVGGGGIKEFFDGIEMEAEAVVSAIRRIVSAFVEFFQSIRRGGLDAFGEAFSRLGGRLGQVGEILSNVGDLWGPLKEKLGGIGLILDEVWTKISEWFSQLGDKLKNVFKPGDFDTSLDAVNTGLLAGIVLLLRNFFKNGLKLDFGGGFLEGVTGTLDQLTGTLKAMQTDIKANALLKIAAALGILTASVMVLSMVDSVSLTKALIAMGVGFGALVATFATLNVLALGPTTSVKMGILAGGLVLLAGAMLILSLAVEKMSEIGWADLAKGLLGVSVMLGAITLAAGPLGKSSGGMIRAGLAMIPMAIGLNLLADAVKSFGKMSWADMGKGLAGVAGGLILMAGAMRLLPEGMAAKGVGILFVAGALNLLALAVRNFGSMDWDTMSKGMAGIAGGLLITGLSLKLFPKNMVATGAGLVLVSGALLLIAKAVESFGGLSWGEMAKGLLAMGGSLIILALGAKAMSGSLAGAAAMVIMAAGLGMLVVVIKEIANLSIAELVTGLLGIAAVLGILGAAAFLLAPLAPALLALGAALIMVGAAFALFGLGASLTAKAFQILAEAGQAGIGILIMIIDAVIEKIPALVQAFAVGLVELAQVFVDAAPILIAGLGVILEQLLQMIITLVPKIGEVLVALLTTVITVIREMLPQFIQLGMDMILALLTAIRDNIYQIATVAVEIIVQFVSAITANIGMIITAAIGLIVAFINGIAMNLGQIIAAGVNLLVSFINGISNNMPRVVAAVVTLIVTFINTVSNNSQRIISAGTDALVDFLRGIGNNLAKVATAAVDVVVRFIETVGNNASRIVTAGVDALVDFLEGIKNNLGKVATGVREVITKFIDTAEANASRLVTAGVDAVIAFIRGVGQNAIRLARAAADVIIDFVNALADTIENKAGELREAGKRLAFAIVDGATFGLTSKARALADKAVGVFKSAVGAVGGFLGIGSPSRLFMQYGDWMMEGLAIGIVKNTHPEERALGAVKHMTRSVENALTKLSSAMGDTADFNPVITPVLDLTGVTRDAKTLSSLIPSSVMTPTVSYLQAQTIASTRIDDPAATTDPATAARDVIFNQEIHAPEQLSTADIYRQSRNLLTLAKEELNIR